jgi:hypothetical protein
VNTEQLAARLRVGSVVLAFDTNAVYGDRRLFTLCDRMTAFNDRLRGQGHPDVQLVVSTVVYAEKLFDLKQRYGQAFNLDEIVRGLRQKKIELQAFDSHHALATAVRLGEKYKDDAEWQRAKRARYIAALGLPNDTAVTATGRNCGATVDWLVGGHAQAEGAILVTDDNDPEFGGTIERVRLDILEAALDELLAEPV